MLISVDSSVILDWLVGEKKPPEEMAGMHDIFSGIDTGKYQCICPPVLMREVLPDRTQEKHGVDITDGYNALVRCMIVISNPPNFGKKVTEFQNKFNFDPADAEHVAMAVITGCRYHCTSDRGVLRGADAIKLETQGRTEIIKPPIPWGQ